MKIIYNSVDSLQTIDFSWSPKSTQWTKAINNSQKDKHESFYNWYTLKKHQRQKKKKKKA